MNGTARLACRAVHPKALTGALTRGEAGHGNTPNTRTGEAAVGPSVLVLFIWMIVLLAHAVVLANYNLPIPPTLLIGS
jgi:hypothetical protein